MLACSSRLSVQRLAAALSRMHVAGRAPPNWRKTQFDMAEMASQKPIPAPIPIFHNLNNCADLRIGTSYNSKISKRVPLITPSISIWRRSLQPNTCNFLNVARMNGCPIRPNSDHFFVFYQSIRSHTNRRRTKTHATAPRWRDAPNLENIHCGCETI